MKLITNYFNTVLSKPSNLFYINLFILKNNLYFNIKYLLHIHFFFNIKNILNIKILKFNYKFYNSIILNISIINVLIQFIYFFLNI